jgi:chromosome segregation ATPase
MTMLDDVEWSEQSDREIAIACDVSHPFVARLRRAAGKQPEMINVKRGDVEYKLPNAAMKEKYEPDMQPEEEDKIIEMATEMQSMVEELEASQRRLAVAAMEATPEEKKLASVKLEEMATEITSLSENNRVLRVSRDTFQNECAELKKQAMYGKRRYEKAEKEITSLQKEVDFWKDRALTAEAHLAIDKAA